MSFWTRRADPLTRRCLHVYADQRRKDDSITSYVQAEFQHAGHGVMVTYKV